MFVFQYLYFPFLFLTAVFASTYEKILNSNEDYLPEQPLNTEEPKNSNILPLDLRSLADWELTDLLLVSDIDGNLHGVERNTGSFLWSLPIDEPLVKILRDFCAPKSSSSESNLLWFVEPYQDGSLYYFAPQYGLNKLPTSIKNLVMESPFSLSGDNKIYTGARKTSLYTININTGEILSQFGSLEDEKCPIPNVYRTPNIRSNSDENTILIGKTTFELSIHSKIDSNVVWNVTYSLWGPNNIDNDLIMQNVQSSDNLYFTPFHDKSLLAINKNLGTPAWISKLPSLAVNVFDVFNRNSNYVVLPHPLKVLNDLQIDTKNEANNDLCFVNKTANGKEWFAMSFLNYPTLLKSAPVSRYQMSLYKHENGLLSDQEISFISNFSVSDAENENLLNGVHRINHLYPENLYQPVSKFTRRPINLIGDGSESSNKEHSKPNVHELQQIPTIMDGILFPETKPQYRQDLATIDHQDDHMQVHDGDYSTTLPPARYNQNRHIPNDRQSKETISVFRRIAEDIFVMSALMLFFMACVKVNQILRDRRELRDVDTYEEVSEKIHTLDTSEPSSDTFVEESAAESKTALEETESQNSGNSPVKRVSIIAPGDSSTENPDSEGNKEGEEDTEKEGDNTLTKKKRKRGSRGGKRGGKGKKNAGKEGEETRDEINDEHKEDVVQEESDNEQNFISTKSLVRDIIKPSNQLKKLQIDSNLVISDKILGYGSHGTVVYEGSFENRPVAVKRMLLDFYEIANHEVRLLQESDDHPNVIRYFCSQSSESEKFLYIALELCSCSLDEIIEKRHDYSKALWLKPSAYCDALYQLASGLHYLHSLKIVHRDLKPQNILVGDLGKTKSDACNSIRLLISDFGLCKKLDGDQSSFRATTQNAASGTSGWRAPELLLSHDLLEISPDTVSSINSSSRHSLREGSNTSGAVKRLTKAIDIFSLGCVFYYILSGGGHPYGDRYMREGNIIRGEFDLSGLKDYCPDDFVEATDLISSMISSNPKSRPDTGTILKHPYFWSYNKKLEFLLKVSDRFEIERRDPPSDLLVTLEQAGPKVHLGDWLNKFDKTFIDNLGKYRKYQGDKLMDLLRALRNKYHHYNDMPLVLQLQMSPLPHGFYKYFNTKFPNLLMETYYVVKSNLHDEHIFQEFF